MRIRQSILIVLCALSLAALGACSSRTKVESDLGIKGAPDWVNEGTQAVSNKKGRLIHGIGSAAPMGDDALQLSTADNRARAELAQVLSTYMDVVGSDYTASVRVAGGDIADQSVSRDIKAVSQVVLNGARIIGHWRDKRTGNIYSIAELDMNEVKKAVQAQGEISPGLKTYMNDKGDAAFDQFAKERN